jgi:hypothetical protein
MTAFKRISPRKGKTKEAEFNSIDIAWTEPFQVLHEKWFSKVWEEDQKKGKAGSGNGKGGGIIKMEMSQSDAVRRLCCIEHDLAFGSEIRISTGTKDGVVEERS